MNSSCNSNGYSPHSLTAKPLRQRRGGRRSRDRDGVALPRAAEPERRPCTEFDMAYFQSYSHVGIHEEMIKVGLVLFLWVFFLFVFWIRRWVFGCRVVFRVCLFLICGYYFLFQFENGFVFLKEYRRKLSGSMN